MRRIRLLFTMGLLAGAASIAVATPSFASCAADSGPAGSPVIFVGSAQEERRGFTRFSVDEVWAGPDLAPDVWVQSGQSQPTWPLSAFSGVGSSIDAEFVIGESYLVGATSDFHTDACSVSEAGVRANSELRPDDPRIPVEDGADGADPPVGVLQIGLVGVAVVALLIAPVALWRRRRRTG